MKTTTKQSEKNEKFTSNIKELIELFGVEPHIVLPYAYFGCPGSADTDSGFCTRFFRLSLESGEVECVDTDTYQECQICGCCNVINGIKEYRLEEDNEIL